MKIRKAVIPAGGRGTRLERITLVNAKELIPLVDRPALDWIVKEAIDSGIEEICIVTSANKLSALFEHTRNLEIPVTYLIQSQPRGLGDAVRIAENWCQSEPFALLLPDDFVLGDAILSRLIEQTSTTGASSLALTKVLQANAHKYGIADGQLVEGLMKINGLVEKPPLGTEPSNYSVTGRYVLTPSIWKHLKELRMSVGGELQLTDALNLLALEEPIYGVSTYGMRHDLGSPESWLLANIAYGVEVYGEQWLRNAVSVTTSYLETLGSRSDER